jgi:hypothetical protein
MDASHYGVAPQSFNALQSVGAHGSKQKKFLDDYTGNSGSRPCKYAAARHRSTGEGYRKRSVQKNGVVKADGTAIKVFTVNANRASYRTQSFVQNDEARLGTYTLIVSTMPNEENGKARNVPVTLEIKFTPENSRNKVQIFDENIDGTLEYITSPRYNGSREEVGTAADETYTDLLRYIHPKARAFQYDNYERKR